MVLNMEISPSVRLLPSNLVILKNAIQGYDKLKTETENMVFGINNELNYDYKKGSYHPFITTFRQTGS